MRVLILNSDSPKNRGDRAILAGLIEVVRRRWPDADIHALSQFDERDERWFGIRFLPQSPYSIRPLDYLRLLRHARTADVVLWGGGEILKDYTNRLGLLYWALKITGVSLVNRNVFGAFQGIGPTSAPSSRRAIAYTVGRTRGFVVRDEESADKLRAWGVRIPVTASFDPAILAPVAPWSDDLAGRLQTSLDVDGAFLDDVVGMGVRRWFHYRKGGWLPFALRGESSDTADFETYRDNLVRLADRITAESSANLLFFPMHMAASEGDDALAHDIISRMKEPHRARVLDDDRFSPAELSAVIQRCDYFVASRLHSAILAACARVPALVLYYVDKGRLFYEQLGLPELSRPIERMLEPDAVDEVMGLTAHLAAHRDEVIATVDTRVGEMGDRLVADARSGWPGV
ncbi:polysaccharide pyruvyl transferase family protein [Microbacterium aureliae]